MKKPLLLLLSLILTVSIAKAVEVTDVLTAELLGVSGYDNQVEYSSEQSGATYVAAATKSTAADAKGAIQMNAIARSGIAVKESRGTLKQVILTFAKACTKGLSVYASADTPYTSYTNTVDNTTLISSPITDTETVLFTDGEKYFYIRPGGGAAYLSSVSVVWEVDRIIQRSASPEILSSNGFSFYPSTDVSFTAADGAEIYYSIDTELTEDNYQTVGTRYAGSAFSLDKSATVYALAIESGKDPSKVVSRQFTCEFVQPMSIVCDWNDALFTGTGADGVRGSELTQTVQPLTSIACGDFELSFLSSSGTKPGFFAGASPKSVRVYTGTEVSVTAVVVNRKITKVVFNSEAGAEVREFSSVNMDGVTQTIDGQTLTCEIPGGITDITFKAPSKVQKWTSVEIYYNKVVDLNTSFSPVIESSNGPLFYPSTEISLTAAEGSSENVALYYNVNSDADPTPETGTRYNGPFELNETAVIKAIAVDGNKAPSEVSVMEVRRIAENRFDNIVALLSAEPTPAPAEVVILSNPVTITGLYELTGGGSYYLYVKDASGELMIYSRSAFPASYVPGAVISDFAMTYQVYKDLPEGVATEYISSFGEPVAAGDAPSPSVVTEVGQALYNHYVVFNDVTVADGKIQIEPALTVQNKFVGCKPPTWNAAKSYNITGMVGHDASIDKLYYVASEELPAGPAPQMCLEEDYPELVTFGVCGYVGMEVPGISDAVIYYTLDGSDPIGNADALRYEAPVKLTVTTTVKAYAKIPGKSPSEVVERTFTKEGNDIVYIKDFIGWEDKAASLHFVGDVTVMAQSADYLFVEGALGHHLAIKASDGWGAKSYVAGDKISDFVISHPAAAVADVNIAEADVATFHDAVSGDAPMYRTVNASDISDASYMGYPISIVGAHLAANDLQREAGGWSVEATVPVDFSQFGTVDGWPSVADEAVAYNIKGVIMRDADGNPVIWPMAVETESGDRTAVPQIVGQAQFSISTMIEIRTVTGAVVYYTLDGSDPVAEESGATMRYDGPFEINRTTTVKAIAVVDGKEPSAVATAKFIETVTTGIDAVGADDCAVFGGVGSIVAPEGAEIYDLSGRMIRRAEGLVPGVYIVRYDGKCTKVLVR